jgi:hypothetical protein
MCVDRKNMPPVSRPVEMGIRRCYKTAAEVHSRRRLSVRTHDVTSSRTSQCHHQPAQGDNGADPESEHPPEQVGAYAMYLTSELRNTLLQLRVKPSEVELVHFSEICPVGQVHSIQPIYQLVGNILT